MSEEIGKMLHTYLDDSGLDEAQVKTGLSLLSTPTGSGKSYTVAMTIGQKISEGVSYSMFYIVNTKSNLVSAYNDLIKAYPIFKERVLYLKENAEMVLDFFKNEPEEMPLLKDILEYKTLRKRAIHANENLDNLDFFRDKINSDASELQKKLRGLYKGAEGQAEKNKIKREVGKLFPTTIIDEYDAVFMTTQKFLYPIWSLSGSQYIYNLKKLEGSKLFVDEFDAQKSVILDHLIKQATRLVIDKIGFFNHCYFVLNQSSFLGKYNLDENVCESVIKMFSDIYTKYIDGFAFVYPSEENKSACILRSASGISNFSLNGSLTIKRDEKSFRNIVVEGGNYEFIHMVSEIDKAISRLVGLGYMATHIAKNNAVESGEWADLDEVSEQTMREFVEDFNFNQGDKGYEHLYSLIQRRDKSSDRVLVSDSQDFYDNGLSLARVEDTNEDAKRSKFNFFNLNETPEGFIVKVASTMHIIGMSATATIPSVIRNFDLSYLKSRIHVESLSHDEAKKMNRLYIDSKQQSNRAFHVEFVNGEYDDITEVCNEYFEGDFSALDYLNGLLRQVKEFRMQQYIRILHIYREFIDNPEIKSFLVLLPGYPKSEDKVESDEYRPMITEELGQLILMMLELRLHVNKIHIHAIGQVKALLNKRNKYSSFSEFLRESNELFYIYTSEPKSVKYYDATIKKNLEKGNKQFIISSYAAMGIGRNIQYSAGESPKDFDAIYCDKLTNLIIRQMSKENPVASVLKLLYQLDSLKVSRNYTEKEHYRFIEKALQMNSKAWNNIQYNERIVDYSNTLMIFVIQAIGRLHRQNNPDDPLYIFIDKQLLPAIRSFDPSGHTLLPSVEKLLEKAGYAKNDNIRDKEKHFKNAIESKSIHMNHKIQLMLKSFHSEQRIQQWKDDRTFLLSNPTVQNLEIIQQGFYEAMPTEITIKKYWYTQENDYQQVDAYLEHQTGAIEVSRRSAKLHIIEAIPELQECVKKHNISLEFNHRCLMTPVVFNNLYKGALGEAIGRHILQSQCGVILNEISVESKHYEFFDFVTPSGVYIDFKYYSQQNIETTLESEVRDIAKKKLLTIGHGKALVINIFYQRSVNNPNIRIEYKDNVAIVPFLIDSTNESKPVLETKILKRLGELLI